ncbi:MAG: hypothetical protein ACJA1F_000734 [Paracoccaceae bacterium]|jgi:hypothetical protein
MSLPLTGRRGLLPKGAVFSDCRTSFPVIFLGRAMSSQPIVIERNYAAWCASVINVRHATALWRNTVEAAPSDFYSTSKDWSSRPHRSGTLHHVSLPASGK